MVSPGHLGGSIRHYITLHEDPDHLEQSSHDASNICEDTEHERNPDDSEEEAEQAAAERAGCKVAVAWETQDVWTQRTNFRVRL